MLKSFLHQSSDVWKATKEAWEESGQPSTFTVKILDQGVKGFLGFSKEPATISFTFSPSNKSMPPNLQAERAKNRESREWDSNIRQRNQKTSKNDNRRSREYNSERFDFRDQKTSTDTRKEVKNQETKNGASENHKKNNLQHQKKTNQNQNEKNDIWTKELVDKALNWSKDFMSTAKISGTIRSEEQQSFGSSITFFIKQNPEDKDSNAILGNNLFICSWATLIVQGLRNSYGQRLKGLRIRILKE